MSAGKYATVSGQYQSGGPGSIPGLPLLYEAVPPHQDGAAVDLG